MPTSPLTKARTALALGIPNLLRVASYRLRLKAGIHPAQRIVQSEPVRGPFFDSVATTTTLPTSPAWTNSLCYFGWFAKPVGDPPDWHLNPFNGRSPVRTDEPWWSLPDFDASVGDIKTIWEASRFDWVLSLSQRVRANEPQALARLNAWLTDWSERNPPYRGHNWKCGQEASLRLLHLAVAAIVVDQVAAPRPELIELVTHHLRRIAPSIAYAVGQDNNHGTSEAAALFVGGSWLESVGRREGRDWQRLGRRWLTDRIERLIEPDGSFSQYSVNYHRLMLDTASVAELWRRRLGLEPFPRDAYDRLATATQWLGTFVDPRTGGVANLGANDGANLLPLTGADYCDYRPSVQLAATLFLDQVAYPHAGVWQTHLQWLGLSAPAVAASPRRSALFDDGGYAVLHRGQATAVLRYPRFRFRPNHADALHLDLSVDSENLLRDGGSYSYADAEWHAYFTGARGHNTVQFDDHEQMPRLSRFLWGNWLETKAREAIREDDDTTMMSASYSDEQGAEHRRSLMLGDSTLRVTDEVQGFSKRAVLRWRLQPGHWTMAQNQFTNGTHVLSISASVPIVRSQLVEGWESRYYLRRTEVPVVEIEIASAGAIVSEYRWKT